MTVLLNLVQSCLKSLARNLFKIFLLVDILIISGCVQQPRPESQLLDQAKNDFEQQNYKNAFSQLLPLAKKGHAEAQYSVGYMYYYGLGVVENTQQAKYWIRQSAQQGNKNAVKALQLEKFARARI